jgi:hypothetical protein
VVAEGEHLSYTLQYVCLSEKNIGATWLISLTHPGTEEHRELLCLVDHKNVRQSPIPAEDQGWGLSN